MTEDHKSTTKLKSGSLTGYFSQLSRSAIRFRILIFVIFVGLVYGMVAYKIFSASDLQPSGTNIQTKVSNLKPTINEDVANKLKNLEDNSVSVKTLFQKARQNPFNE